MVAGCARIARRNRAVSLCVSLCVGGGLRVLRMRVVVVGGGGGRARGCVVVLTVSKARNKGLKGGHKQAKRAA